MGEIFKALMMGMGCLGLLWLGSCAFFGVGAVVALQGAAQNAKTIADKQEESRWSRQSSRADWASRRTYDNATHDEYQAPRIESSRRMGQPSARLGEPSVELPNDD